MNDNTILKSLRFVCHLNVHSLLLADVKLNFTLAICQTKSLFMMFCFEWPKVVATVRKMFIGLSMVVLVFPKQMAGWKNAPKSGVPKWYPKWLWPWCPRDNAAGTTRAGRSSAFSESIQTESHVTECWKRVHIYCSQEDESSFQATKTRVAKVMDCFQALWVTFQTVL